MGRRNQMRQKTFYSEYIPGLAGDLFMSEIIRILGALGEGALLLPALVNAALSANDRVKCRFTLLQAVRQSVEHPGMAPSRLTAERIAAGVRAAELDQVVAGATQVAPRRADGRRCLSSLRRPLQRPRHSGVEGLPAPPRLAAATTVKTPT